MVLKRSNNYFMLLLGCALACLSGIAPIHAAQAEALEEEQYFEAVENPRAYDLTLDDKLAASLKDKELVFFIGPTRGGKSVLINYLLGHKFRHVRVRLRGRAPRVTIDAAAAELPVAAIAYLGKPESHRGELPMVYIPADQPFAYVEVPAFEHSYPVKDSDANVQALMAAAFERLQFFIQHAKGIRALVGVCDSLWVLTNKQRLNPLRYLLFYLDLCVEKVEDHMPNVVWAFTHIDVEEDEECTGRSTGASLLYALRRDCPSGYAPYTFGGCPR